MAYSPVHLDRLRLRHLRLLEVIDRVGSLRAVGVALGLTQPAVSQMLKDLEYAFGVQLVARSARGVSLTAAGRLALQRSRAGIATFDHLAQELGADQLPLVRLGTNPAMLSGLIPKALAALDPKPRFRLRIRTGLVGEMNRALLDGEIDCYVGRFDWDLVSPEMAATVRHDPLMVTPLTLACSASHPLANAKTLSNKELAACAWLLPGPGSNNRAALETGLKNLGLPGPVPMVEVDAGPFALVQLALEINAVICVPAMVLEPFLASGEMRMLDFPNLKLAPIHIGFVTLTQNEHVETIRLIREWLARRSH